MPRQGRKWVDCFGGRGNILFRAIHEGLEYDQWIINDLYRAPFYRAIKEHGDKFRCTEKTPAEFYRLKELAAQGDCHALLMEPWLTWSGSTYEAGGSSTQGGMRTPEAYEANMRQACRYLREKKVKITQLDWLTCLAAEGLGAEDFVMFDPPYAGTTAVVAYTCDSVSPLEIVNYLKTAPHSWLLTEHKEPLYVLALGEPVLEQAVQLRMANFHDTDGQGSRIECVWTNKNVAKGNTVTLPAIHSDVPENRKDSYYQELPLDSLLKEIRDSVAAMDAARGVIDREMRARLLPALIALREKTKRKKPGFYDHLIAMGITPGRFKMWFHRAQAGIEIEAIIEEAQPEEQEPELRRDHREEATGVDSRIHCGDAVTLMDKMPAGSVPLIVTSPPYNLRNSTGNGMKYANSGMWESAKLTDGYDLHDDAMPHADYVKWQRECLTSMMRVLREDGAIFYNHKWRVQDGLLQDRSDIVKGFPVRQIIIWQRGGLNFNDGYFLPSYEVIYLIAKPDFKLAPGAHSIGDVWRIPPETDNPHPAPFPVDLALRCIQSTTAELVLDPFMGSGTTAIAAEQCGRGWIGIELSEKYCKMATERIKPDGAACAGWQAPKEFIEAQELL